MESKKMFGMLGGTFEERLFWTQLQAPAGNYVDRTGYQTLEAAKSGMRYEQNAGNKCRVVTKTITVVAE